MPDRDPTRNIEFTQIPTAAELMGINTEAYRDALDEASALHDNVFGEVEEPTPADEAELDSLRSQYEMLTQPRPQFAPVGERIQGNEFSVSVRSLSQGLNDLVAGVDRERRRNALFGDPERQEQMRLEAQELDSEAQKLEEQAEKIVGGEIPLDAMTIGTPLIRGEDGLPIESERKKFANRYLERAQELRSESEIMREQLNQYSGVSGQLRSAEREAEEAERESEFERQFKLTFGQQLFETAQQTINNRADLRSREVRETVRQQSITQRQIAREREITNRTLLRMQSEGREPIDGPDATPNEQQHRYVMESMKSFQRDMDDEIRNLRNQGFAVERRGEIESLDYHTARTWWSHQYRNAIDDHRTAPDESTRRDAERRAVRAREGLENVETANRLISQYSGQKKLAERIRLDAVQWRDSSFEEGQLPSLRPPTQEDERFMEQIFHSAIPNDAVQAWMFYNRIDPNAPPQVSEYNNQQTQPGSY